MTTEQPEQGGQTPPAGQQPPQAWQSTPQPPPPAAPPAGSGMPSWTANITAQGTMPGPGGVALADTPNRIIAAVIDFIILGIVGFVVNMLTTSILGDNWLGGIFGLGGYKVPSLLSSLASVALMLGASGAYFVYMWSRMGGATVGMRFLKLSVRDASSGGPISQGQAINRWLLLGAPYALTFMYGWGIGFIISLGALVWYIYLLYTMAQSPTRQGMHDTYAKTVVAKG